MKFYHTSDIHLGAVPDGCFPWSKARGEEIYDSFITVRLLTFERPEQKFADVEELKEQLQRDIVAGAR